MKNPVSLRAVVLSFALLATGSCGEPTGPSGFEFLVQVRAIFEPDAPPPTAPARAPGITSIEIEEAVVVFGGLTLESAGLDSTTDWILAESVVVPLRLSGDPTLAFAPSADDGQYGGIRVSVDRLDPEVPDEASLIAVFPRLANVSVLVEGTLVRTGVSEAFSFTTSLPTDTQLEFERPRSFTADAKAVAVFTVTVDLDDWFETPGGELLDPDDEADRAAIEESLLGSIAIHSGS